MREEWKSIADWEGLYEVSSLGRVRSLRSSKVMRPWRTKDGRNLVTLTRQRKVDQKAFYLHRLVLDAFAGTCPDGMEACHNDGDQDNNALSNLRWDTHKGNVADKLLHGTILRGEGHPMSKLKSSEVRQIRLLRTQGHTARSLATQFSCSIGAIDGVVSGRNWKHCL